MKQYTVNVTEKDIRRGKAGNLTKCPIARALKHAMFWNFDMRYRKVLVTGTYVSVRDGRYIDLPQEAMDFKVRLRQESVPVHVHHHHLRCT